MKPVLTDELLDYLGDMYSSMYAEGSLRMTFQQYLEWWLNSRKTNGSDYSWLN